jgi:hypothetical protein
LILVRGKLKPIKRTLAEEIIWMKDVCRYELKKVGLEYNENATLYDNLFRCPKCNFRNLHYAELMNHVKIQHNDIKQIDIKKETLPN